MRFTLYPCSIPYEEAVSVQVKHVPKKTLAVNREHLGSTVEERGKVKQLSVVTSVVHF